MAFGASKPNSSLRDNLSRLRIGVLLLLAGCLFYLASPLGQSVPSRASAPSATLAFASVGRQPQTKNIEDIRVGERVSTNDAWSDKPLETQVNPATWRRLTLRAETRWADSTLDTINVETLQPPEWIAAQRTKIGASVPLPLDLVEMGLPADLRATVVANDACPQIAPGPGRVVLTTVDHLNPDVWELTVTAERGRREIIHPTGWHKFYSASRGKFVSVRDLRPGEELRGINGPLHVETLHALSGVQRVYNMTVEQEHVYRVSNLGVLVHNDCPQDLARQLTSEEQLGQALTGNGEPIAGAGADVPLRDADRLAQDYGGNPDDWAKMRSDSSLIHDVTTPNGENFETHWYQNTQTGEVVEIKTKVAGH